MTFGDEVRTFEPFGSTKAYCIKDFEGRLARIYAGIVSNKPTESVMRNLGKAQEGFAESYGGVLELVEIKSVKVATPENYPAN